MKWLYTILLIPFFLPGRGQDTLMRRVIIPVEITDAKDIEKEVITLRRNHFLSYPASFDDPSRLLLKFPAVSVLNDQSNLIIYRGMPPHFSQWSLYGAPIVNPNHLSNTGTLTDRSSRSGGGVNMFSGQVIGSMQYWEPTQRNHLGNGLAGIANLELRNSYRNQQFLNLGLIGLEGGLERSDERKDLLFNFRYSTLGLLSAAGVDLGDEEIAFQDAVASLHLKDINGGNLRIYGAVGFSKNDHEALKEENAEEIKDIQDIFYDNTIWMGGLNYFKKSESSELNATLNISGKSEDRRSSIGPGIAMGYGVEPATFDFDETLLSGVITKNKRNIGFRQTVNAHFFGLGERDDAYLLSRSGMMIHFGDEDWFRIHTMTELVVDSWSGQISVEPTISYDTDRWTIAYSYRSMMQTPEAYLSGMKESLRRSASYNGSIEYRRGVTTRLFYHRLLDLPAYFDGQVLFHDMAHQDGQIDFPLDNEGEATIYGIGFSYEADLTERSRIRFNTSIFKNESKIEDEITFDSPYNFGHLSNLMWLHRWDFGDNNYLQWTTSLHYRGGAYDQMIDLQQSRQQNRTVYDFDELYDHRLSDYWRLDMRLNYIIQGTGKKQVISLDIQNVTSRQNDAYRYYDPLADAVLLKKQLGLIPVLSYRIVW